jgi:acetyl-CoA acetyltransferase
VAASEIQLMEVNDQSTMMEMVSLEDLGFCSPGTAWKSIFESYQKNQLYYEFGGKPVYVNTDGGLKADGNPLGATGGAMVYEVFRQLRGQAADRQVKVEGGLKYGGILEFEGFGTKAYATILGENPQ